MGNIVLSELLNLPLPRTNFSHTHLPFRHLDYFGHTFESYVGMLLKLQHKQNLIRTDVRYKDFSDLNSTSRNPDYMVVNQGVVSEIIEVKGGRTPNNGYDQFVDLSVLDVPLHLIYYPSDKNASSLIKRLQKRGIQANATSFQDLPVASFFKGTNLHRLLSDKGEYDSFSETNSVAHLDRFVDALYTKVEQDVEGINYLSNKQVANIVKLMEAYFEQDIKKVA
jgi:hypothetical protein